MLNFSPPQRHAAKCAKAAAQLRMIENDCHNFFKSGTIRRRGSSPSLYLFIYLSIFLSLYLNHMNVPLPGKKVQKQTCGGMKTFHLGFFVVVVAFCQWCAANECSGAWGRRGDAISLQIALAHDFEGRWNKVIVGRWEKKMPRDFKCDATLFTEPQHTFWKFLHLRPHVSGVQMKSCDADVFLELNVN